jgi:hypothetical protein
MSQQQQHQSSSDAAKEATTSSGDVVVDATDELFEIDSINLEITRCELQLLRHKKGFGKKVDDEDDEAQRPRTRGGGGRRRWTNSNATVYRKPNERSKKENVIEESAFPDLEPFVVEGKDGANAAGRRSDHATEEGATTTTRTTNRHSLERALRKADEEKQSTYTFRPRTIAKAFMEEDSERRKARRERLLQSRLDIVRAREAAKREAEKAAFEKECTFRPKILATKSKNEGEEDVAENVSDRLYVEARVREERLRERREREEQKMQEELRRTSARKATSSSSSASVSPGLPMHERLKELSEKRERVMREAAQKVDEAFREAHTFKPPKMRSTSEKLAALANRRKKDNDTVTLKLKATRENVGKESGEKNENTKTSSPKGKSSSNISAKSEKIVRKNIQSGKIGEGFLERQYEFASRIRAKRADTNALREKLFDIECTFSPEIHSSTSPSFSEKYNHYYETQNERARRLAITEAQDMHQRAENMRRERDRQFTFVPKINDKSNLMANPTNLDELASSKSRDLEREAAKRVHEMETLKECTFSPHVNQKTDDADFLLAVSKKSGSYGKYDADTITNRVKSEKEAREYNLEQARREREFEERKTCTFSPQIRAEIGIANPHVPAEDIVKGIDKYYDNVEKATKIRAEKESRRQKVFLENVSQIDVRHKITKPKEFNFAKNQTQRLREREEMLKREKLKREMKECTFRPKINDYYRPMKKASDLMVTTSS